MIKCEICKQEFKQISNTHLIEHNIDKNEYRRLFPEAKLKSVWNLGLNKESDKRVLKNALALKANHWVKDEEKKKNISNKISLSKTGGKISEKIKEQFRQKYKGQGNPNFGNTWSDEQKKESSDRMKEKYKDPEYVEKFKNSHWSNNEEKKQIVTKKASEYIANAISLGIIKINTGYKCGWIYSEKMKQEFYYMSSYELRRMILLEKSELVKEYTNKHGIKLQYNNKKGGLSYYIPDILITFYNGDVRLEEVKGYVRDKDVFTLKNEVAKSYCKENNIEYKIIFKKDIENL